MVSTTDRWACRQLGILLAAIALGCGGGSVVDGSGRGGEAGAVPAGGGGAGGDGQGGLAAGGGTAGGGACGDPSVAERYPSCLAADDQPACTAAGGSWDIIGLAPGPECQCPTGQGSCACRRQSECLSTCIAEPTGGVFECDGVVVGHCSPVSITVGCWCFFDEEGVVSGLCVD